jgi:mRNA-degrading endonuclease toxin of MazEF toxin-antitoxin module
MTDILKITRGDVYYARNLAQIRTLDKRRLITPKIATLPDRIMIQVDKALKHSLSLT